jgi:hypothetical protein
MKRLASPFYSPKYVERLSVKTGPTSAHFAALRDCLVNNRVGLGGAKSASFTWRTASCEHMAGQLPQLFEMFLPKRAIR